MLKTLYTEVYREFSKERVVPKQLMAYKKYFFLLFLLPVASSYCSALLSKYIDHPNFLTYLPLVFVFVIIPILDYLIGKDPYNYDEQETQLENQTYFKWLTLICVPLQYITILFGIYFFVNSNLNFLGAIGWVLSIGITSGSMGVTVAHELIHKNSQWERFAGGLLLISVCYSTFKIEHVRGHHVWIGTEKDKTTSKFNESVYTFLSKVLRHNFVLGWQLQFELLRKRGKFILGWHNELLGWHVLNILLIAAITYYFGVWGAVFFIIQSLVAICVLETINYIEHYGLIRKPQEHRGFEKINLNHSWTTDYMLTNVMLFQLQRHPDHHVQAKRRYQTLRHHENSPQLPAGYPTMMLMALVPPLWFKVMNPLVPKN